jgi:hypothetical protein
LRTLIVGPTPNGKTPGPKESRKWLSLHSFAVELNGSALVDTTIFALYTIRNALEEENPVRELANCHISLASAWIIRSGMRFYREVLNPVHKDRSYMKSTVQRQSRHLSRTLGILEVTVVRG